jgi:hypothetical protein
MSENENLQIDAETQPASYSMGNRYISSARGRMEKGQRLESHSQLEMSPQENPQL